MAELAVRTLATRDQDKPGLLQIRDQLAKLSWHTRDSGTPAPALPVATSDQRPPRFAWSLSNRYVPTSGLGCRCSATIIIPPHPSGNPTREARRWGKPIVDVQSGSGLPISPTGSAHPLPRDSPISAGGATDDKPGRQPGLPQPPRPAPAGRQSGRRYQVKSWLETSPPSEAGLPVHPEEVVQTGPEPRPNPFQTQSTVRKCSAVHTAKPTR